MASAKHHFGFWASDGKLNVCDPQDSGPAKDRQWRFFFASFEGLWHLG